MDNQKLWELTAETAFKGKDMEKEHARRRIRTSIIEDIFGRMPIRKRNINKDPNFRDDSFVVLIDKEISTIFNYVDKATNAIKKEENLWAVKENKHIVNLLKKYKSNFKKYPKELDKLQAAIKMYNKAKG